MTRLDPEVARRVTALSWRARRAVDGLLSGIHRSPHRGASVVFVEHRDYRAGDDLRLLDWKAFARTDRHVIKRFEQETHLRATLVLDKSASMAFAGTDGRSKMDHAATLLGALAYVLIRQGDAVGAVTFDTALRDGVPPRSRPAQLELTLGALVGSPTEGAGTELGQALSEVAEQSGRRGVVAIASDLLDLRPDALTPLGQLVGRGHDVVVFHVLHTDELELPYHGAARFVGTEGEPAVEADPDAVRPRYQQELNEFLGQCRRRATAAGARYMLAPTHEPPERTLAALIATGRRR